MKPVIQPEGLLERVALWGNLGPYPVAEAMFSMIISRVIMAGVRLGVYRLLSGSAFDSGEAAARLGLDPAGTAHLLDSLVSVGHLRKSGGRYAVTARARRWLDPESPTYVGGFLEFNYDQWEWWSGLEEVVRSGRGFEIHGYGEDDPRWERYIHAMHQLARLSAPEVAAKVRLPADPKRLLDLAGAHGWFAAELCRRHASLKASVIDLPGSVRIGKQIIREAGMGDRVEHVEGDILTDSLTAPVDGVLCFQIIHHLSPGQNLGLFRKAHAALGSGGTLAVLDYFTPPPDRKPDTAAFLGLHFFLTSTAATYSQEEVKSWMREAGFRTVRKVPIRRLPIQAVIEARKG